MVDWMVGWMVVERVETMVVMKAVLLEYQTAVWKVAQMVVLLE